MLVISAKQMVFSRVEPEYSPKQESGYQTVYASSGISHDEVAFIESRVSCFQPFNVTPFARKQFFILPSGKVVLTHTISIESDPLIVDKDRRLGAFIAHCLIFTPDAFHKILNNPFKIFEQFQFLISPQEMVRSFDQKHGKEPPCEIQIDPYNGNTPESVLWRQAPEMYAYANQAMASKEKITQLLLLGSAQQIEQFLSAFMAIASPETRLTFSFSTNIDSCNLQSGNYWAVGTSKMPDGRFQIIRLSGMDSLPFDSVTKSDDLYAGWLLHNKNLHPKSYLEITSAQAISIVFRKKQPIPGFVESSMAKDFFLLYQNKIRDMLHKVLSTTLSPQLSDLTLHFFMENPDYGTLLTIASSNTIQSGYLSKTCRQVLVQAAPLFDGLQKAEWNVISDFSEKAPDALLGFWAACMLQNQKKTRILVEQLSQDEFSMAIKLFDAPIKPIYYVSRKHLTVLIDSLYPNLAKMSNVDFCEIVYAINDVEGGNMLAKLSNRIGALDNKSLTDMEGKVKNVKNLAPAFEQAIKSHRKKLGAPAGIAGWFYKEK